MSRQGVGSLPVSWKSPLPLQAPFWPRSPPLCPCISQHLEDCLKQEMVKVNNVQDQNGAGEKKSVREQNTQTAVDQQCVPPFCLPLSLMKSLIWVGASAGVFQDPPPPPNQPREVLQWPYTVGGGGGYPPLDPPPPPRPRWPLWEKRDLQWGKSDRANFGTQNFGSQTPPPPPFLIPPPG